MARRSFTYGSPRAFQFLICETELLEFFSVSLKGLCHTIFVSFQKAKSVLASTEFQK